MKSDLNIHKTLGMFLTLLVMIGEVLRKFLECISQMAARNCSDAVYPPKIGNPQSKKSKIDIFAWKVIRMHFSH